MIATFSFCYPLLVSEEKYLYRDFVYISAPKRIYIHKTYYAKRCVQSVYYNLSVGKCGIINYISYYGIALMKSALVLDI